MAHAMPDLKDQLQAARLQALEPLAELAPGTQSLAGRAAGGGRLAFGALAIQDELNAHEPKVGYEGEQPLA